MHHGRPEHRGWGPQTEEEPVEPEVVIVEEEPQPEEPEQELAEAQPQQFTEVANMPEPEEEEDDDDDEEDDDEKAEAGPGRHLRWRKHHHRKGGRKGRHSQRGHNDKVL